MSLVSQPENEFPDDFVNLGHSVRLLVSSHMHMAHGNWTETSAVWCQLVALLQQRFKTMDFLAVTNVNSWELAYPKYLGSQRVNRNTVVCS